MEELTIDRGTPEPIADAGEPAPEELTPEIAIEERPAARRRGRPRRESGDGTAPGTRRRTKTAVAQESPPEEAPASAPRKRRGKVAREQEAAELATSLVGVLNLAATALLGPEAAMTPIEQTLIEPSLSAILAQVSPRAIARFFGISNYLMLAGGSALWLMRLQQLAAAKRAELAEKQMERRTQETIAEQAANPPLDPLALNGQSEDYWRDLLGRG